jgi:hypothetical protein
MGERTVPQTSAEAKISPDVKVTYRVFCPEVIKDPKTAIIFVSGAFVEGVRNGKFLQAMARRTGLTEYGMNADLKTKTKPDEDTQKK